MSEPANSRISRVLSKLSEVRRRKLSCFGSDSHKFELAAPVAEAAVAAFEAAHGVALPEDYRAFLLTAGNGGAGPYYGVSALEKAQPFASFILDDVEADVLSQPSSLKVGHNPRMASEAGRLTAYQGTLLIGTQGCTYEMLLVVTGECRGRVAYVDSDSNQAPYVLRDADFLSWYERWLDELLGGYEIGAFGYGPGGGEADFLRMFDDPTSDDALKGEAAFALARLPRLTATAALRVNEMLGHALADVRMGALAAVRKFKLAQCVAETLRLMQDASPNVRRQAVLTLIELDPRDSKGAIRQAMLSDADDEVRGAAFYRLADAKLLTRDDLLQIMRAPGPLHSAAAYKHEWRAEDAEVAVALLDDADATARMSAIMALRKFRVGAAAPNLVKLLRRDETAFNISHILNALGDLGNPMASDALLEWTDADDDFHRLEAVQALIELGEHRVLPIAQRMLGEDRAPARTDPNGVSSVGGTTIGDEVRRALSESRDLAFRRLLGEPATEAPPKSTGSFVERLARWFGRR